MAAADENQPVRNRNAEHVAAVFASLPELKRVTQVRRSDNTVVPFEAAKVGTAIADALRAGGIRDELRVAQVTHQALTEVDRLFGSGKESPTTADLRRIVAVALLDHDQHEALRHHLAADAPNAAERREGVRCGRRYTAPSDAPLVENNPHGATAARIARAGVRLGYFSNPVDAAAFQAELGHLLVNEMLSLEERLTAVSRGVTHERVDAFWTRQESLLPRSHVHAGDDFMRAADEDGEWAWGRGAAAQRVPARAMLASFADRAAERGGATLHFDGASNAWHTCPRDGVISGASADGAFTFLEGAAGIAATLHMPSFVGDRRIDVTNLVYAIELAVLAADIALAAATVPEHGAPPQVARGARHFRPLALGFRGQRAALAMLGHAPDTDTGRATLAAAAALLTGRAYAQSAKIARRVGAFPRYHRNERPFLHMIGRHRDAAAATATAGVSPDLCAAQKQAWSDALEHGMGAGFRNAQVTGVGLGQTDDLRLAPIDALRLAAALQPLVSGGIALPLRFPLAVPHDTVVEYVLEAWRLGVKHVTVLRSDTLANFQPALHGEEGR